MYHLPPIYFHLHRIILCFSIVMIVIIGRLFYLQITWSHHYRVQGEKNFLRRQITRSPRGNILDRKGNLLVTNRPITNLCWNGTGHKTITQDQISLLKQVEQLIGAPICINSQLYEAICAAERRCKQIEIAHDITHEQLSKLEELFPGSHNLSLDEDFQRHYPYGPYASHILGYLGKMDSLALYGKTGLEKICDHTLQGQDGTTEHTINSSGKSISSKEILEAIIGNDIHTTIDLDLQHMAEEAFPIRYSGALIIMDPESGALLAMVSRPSFDPSTFLKPISPTAWQRYQTNNPFLNRALNPYPPGSIFKLVTVSAALEGNIINSDTMWQCNGSVDFFGRKYWCHRRWGHGKLNTMQAIAQSCNVLFYEIGKRIDIDLLAHYAHVFGLGKPTGIIFPERAGVVPSRAWKLHTKGELWWSGETLSVTIGQSFLLSSPIQIARMIGSIFTGHLVKPRILQEESVEWEPVLLQQSTIDFLKESMKCVVKRGTGKRVDIDGMEIYAKTSTAQIADFSKRNLDISFLEHAWFAGYIQYASEKPFIFVLLIENAGSSKVAALVAKQFLLNYKQWCDHGY